MEGLTRLVTESLARHGFDRPLDYRRLRWSRWFHCKSHHSLLFVPSKPGVFALAEEVMDLASDVDDRRFSAASGSHYLAALAPAGAAPEAESRKPEAPSPRRMLAVTQFFEDDDMAFVLDRMLSRPNSMNARLSSGRYFVRFVVIEDRTQRHNIWNALNQWMVSAAEKATGIGSHFATSLELTPATEFIPEPDARQQSLFPNKEDEGRGQDRVCQDARAGLTLVSPAVDTTTLPTKPVDASPTATAPQLDSGAATNIHCPSPLPSGF